MLLTRASTPNNTPVDEIHLILNWGRILVVTGSSSLLFLAQARY
jgi:hypothetical protein